MCSTEERAKELQRQYLREWRAKNPEKLREYSQRYWAKKAKAEREEQHETEKL